MEAAVEPCDSVRVDHDDLDDKIEAVEASFRVIPGRVSERTRSGEIDGQAEAGTQTEQQGSQEE